MGVEVPSNPINRKEQYLAKIAGQAVEIPAEPLTREEAYLDEIAKNGSGGGGTSNYNQLDNLPQIGGVTLRGNKSASDLGLASKEEVAGKQDALTKGQYVDITNKVISVQRDIARDVDAVITTSFDFPNCTITKTIDEEVVDTVTFSMFGDIPSSVMDVYSVSFNGQAVVLTFTNTVASKEHAVGYTFQVASYSSGVIDTQTFVETLDADKKLIIQSELDAAVAGKQDKYETITYAQWQTMTPEQQAAKDYYISDYPSSVLTAGNIAYDNTVSGMTANKVQGAIDELKSGLTGQLTVNVTLPATTNGRSSVQLPDATIPVEAKVVGCIITDVSTYSDAVSIIPYFIGRTIRVTMISNVDEVPQITLKLIVGITY